MKQLNSNSDTQVKNRRPTVLTMSEEKEITQGIMLWLSGGMELEGVR